ncbi:hypothetical protein PENANT_c015G10236 [Penicillium antarcticum]|uniref:Uncharacterized protein n=1 Tax=Penicillium antarcticum TaxID=416450 RepID=A0A1V6Q3P9_9EURO|nr:hypothetical protein PENANT_c015G10236 [Penicillium antarcticum]
MRFYMITIATFIGLALASPVEVEKRVSGDYCLKKCSGN